MTFDLYKDLEIGAFSREIHNVELPSFSIAHRGGEERRGGEEERAAGEMRERQERERERERERKRMRVQREGLRQCYASERARQT